jgi:hypothetical protein
VQAEARGGRDQNAKSSRTRPECRSERQVKGRCHIMITALTIAWFCVAMTAFIASKEYRAFNK